jgi:hypothetical protein
MMNIVFDTRPIDLFSVLRVCGATKKPIVISLDTRPIYLFLVLNVLIQ